MILWASTYAGLALTATLWFTWVSMALTLINPGINAILFKRRRPDLEANAPYRLWLVRLGWIWLIVGGESGPGFRPLELDWVRRLRDLAVGARVPFFFKQKAGRQPQQLPCLDEVTWNQMPAQMRGGGGAPQAAATEAPEELPLLRLLEELP